MAQGQWNFLNNGLTAGSVDRGVTSSPPGGIPNGGGGFSFSMNTLDTTVGAVGKYYNVTNFNPAASGGSIRGSLVRATSGGTTGWSPFLFVSLGGNDVADTGYLLGLQDDDPSFIALFKGAVSAGLGAGTPNPPTNQILRRSTNAVAVDAIVHVRLDCIVNGTGDVILKCWQNDLAANPVTAPVWATIAGMADFTDDALQVNTGSAPLTSGRYGLAMHTTGNTGRRASFDFLRIFRQL